MTTTETTPPENESRADTAGEEDHENIETFVGEDADAPEDAPEDVS